MKVPIEVENDDVRDNDAAEASEVDQAVEPDEVDAEDSASDEAAPRAGYDELTPEEEAELVEAAKRAGAAAAEADMKAEAQRAREEAGDLLAQLDEASAQLEAAKKEAAEAADKHLRLQAEWENYRRRTASERIAERERATERLVTNLLPVLDDMERASAHAVSTADGDEKILQFAEGVNAVHAKMLDILSRENVEVIDPVGEAFNPLEHQAVGRVEDHEAYDESVAQVYQRGYRIAGKVIRAAMVTVTYGGPKRPAEENAEQAE